MFAVVVLLIEHHKTGLSKCLQHENKSVIFFQVGFEIRTINGMNWVQRKECSAISIICTASVTRSHNRFIWASHLLRCINKYLPASSLIHNPPTLPWIFAHDHLAVHENRAFVMWTSCFIYMSIVQHYNVVFERLKHCSVLCLGQKILKLTKKTVQQRIKNYIKKQVKK